MYCTVVIIPDPPQRRESTKRAAKEKSNIKQLMAKQTGDEDMEEPPEFVDSDSDPAWTPQARDDVEEEMPVKRGRKPKHGNAYLDFFFVKFDIAVNTIDSLQIIHAYPSL